MLISVTVIQGADEIDWELWHFYAAIIDVMTQLCWSVWNAHVAIARSLFFHLAILIYVFGQGKSSHGSVY